MTDKVAKMDNTAPKMPAQMVHCAIVPMDFMGDIQDVLKEAPFKLAKPILERMATVPVQMVEVKTPDG